jgi:hypothetical protein
MPFLQGRYIFGDFSGSQDSPDGRLYVASPSSGNEWIMDELLIDRRRKLGEYLMAFGQDADNELYVLSSDTQGPEGTSGRVYRIVPSDER